VLDKAEYSAFQSTLNSPIVSYRMSCGCTGLPTVAFMGVLGYGVGYGMKILNTQRRANEDLAVWDYVARHPEDFPEVQRKLLYVFSRCYC